MSIFSLRRLEPKEDILIIQDGKGKKCIYRIIISSHSHFRGRKGKWKNLGTYLETLGKIERGGNDHVKTLMLNLELICEDVLEDKKSSHLLRSKTDRLDTKDYEMLIQVADMWHDGIFH